MIFSILLGIVAVSLLSVILWNVWRLVRSPLPLEMQKALEAKADQKMGLLKDEWSKRLGEELERVWKQVQGQVQTTDKSVSQKLEEANRTFADVKEQLGKLKQATEQVESVGRNVALLQEQLRAPKFRGEFGEHFLEGLLAQIMPQGSDFYSTQYEFLGGERVDAVIRLGDRLVPVDSKFPLDQFRKMVQAGTAQEKELCRREFNQDIKRHIDAISQKYIRPNEGTFDFALMYIPAENVYYEIIIREEGVSDDRGIFQHAIRKKVIPVSPNSFYAYLQVILLGLRGFTVERRAEEILSGLIRLQRELTAVRESFDKAQKQLGFALTNFQEADKYLSRFENKLQSIEAPDSPAELLEKDKEMVKDQ